MTTESEVRPELESAAGLIGQVLDSAQVRQVAQHLDLIATWNRKAHLTSITEPAKAARVHVVDSLLCLRAELPTGAVLLDVGSGAGFPGIPLKIARPDLAVTLLEAASRKAAFLELATAEMGVVLTVVEARAEQAAHDPTWRERFDVAVARAVAPLPALCELVLPFLRRGGKAVLLKGPSVASEVSAGARASAILGGGPPQLMMSQLPGGSRRVVVTIEKVAATSSSYPRRPGVPAKRPLG
ncbi:MAG TPA: 16S rRNA (guanine(527)-N(7))-methyltransferase RsmG [bacterium]|nr:16S rRNA (guanine(527)-N(7))-methyltransferase RsmG [bacterium]